jgi:hypothetical protein
VGSTMVRVWFIIMPAGPAEKRGRCEIVSFATYTL